MKTLEEITEGCDATVVSDEDVAEALAIEFVQKFRPSQDNLPLARQAINGFLANGTSMCLNKGSLKDRAVIEVILAGTAAAKGWKKV